MAEPVTVRPGDIVMVRRGQVYVAVVQRASATEVVVMPCDPRVPDRRVRLAEVIGVYRNLGRPGETPKRLRPSPQLRLDT
jgi:hypothetical protein